MRQGTGRTLTTGVTYILCVLPTASLMSFRTLVVVVFVSGTTSADCFRVPMPHW